MSQGWILELDRGQGIPWKGNYTSWLEQKQERLRKEERAETQRQKTLARELEWVRSVTARPTRKEQSRITAYESLLNQDAEKQAADLEIFIPPGPRLGDLVIDAQSVSKGYGDRLLFDALDFRLPPGGIVGVIGPNGAGKTTLFRLITGQEQADAGSFKVWLDGRAGLCRSVPHARPGEIHLGRDLGWAGSDSDRITSCQFAGICCAIELFRF
jgi:ATPase subunit of ABC transporter with duplicated ATPase domains